MAQTMKEAKLEADGRGCFTVVLPVILLLDIFAAVFSYSQGDHLMMGVLAALGGVLYILGLKTVVKPIHAFCPHCGMHVPSTLPWKCGFCRFENRLTHRPPGHTFLGKCQSCEKRPKAIVCHHCGESIFLDDSNDASHQARVTDDMVPEQSRGAVPPDQQGAVSDQDLVRAEVNQNVKTIAHRTAVPILSRVDLAMEREALIEQVRARPGWERMTPEQQAQVVQKINQGMDPDEAFFQV